MCRGGGSGWLRWVLLAARPKLSWNRRATVLGHQLVLTHPDPPNPPPPSYPIEKKEEPEKNRGWVRIFDGGSGWGREARA